MSSPSISTRLDLLVAAGSDMSRGTLWCPRLGGDQGMARGWDGSGRDTQLCMEVPNSSLRSLVTGAACAKDNWPRLRGT